MMESESLSAPMASHASNESLEDMQKADYDIGTFCKSSIGSNPLEMRMHIMRERFKNLVFLEENESHSDPSSPLAGKKSFT
jgi:hypothetical protein